MTMAECGLEKQLQIEAEVEDACGRKVKLEKIKYVIVTQLSASLLEGTFDVQFWEDWAGEVLTARVKGFVWGEDFAFRTIRYPLDWIEAIKARWLPYWLRCRWPVRYKVHHIQAKAYYPGIQPSMPEQPWRIAAYFGTDEEREESARSEFEEEVKDG